MTIADPNNESAPTRVRYFERQFLRLQDFTDEQAYHLAALRRHQIAHHTWGIVYGLDLAIDPDGKPIVYPGVATDGYGRTLVLPYSQSLPSDAFDERLSDVLDVWLVYNRVAAGSVPDGYAGCASPSRRTTSPLPIDREAEAPLIQLLRPEIGVVDRRHPPGVSANFPPYRNPPDDTRYAWPVFLGQIARQREKPGASDFKYSVDPTGRLYAGLVGEDIIHPDGTAALHLGSSDDDGQAFSVSLYENGKLTPRLAVTAEDELVFYGSTRITDELIVDRGEIAFPVDEEPDGTNLPGPHPWQIYSWNGPVDGPDLAGKNTQQLRLEIGDGGQVVIGGWGKRRNDAGAEVEQFWPCLGVEDDCTVHVFGNLLIDGIITQYPKPGGQAGSNGIGGGEPGVADVADIVEPSLSRQAAAAQAAMIAGRIAAIPQEVRNAAENDFGVNEAGLRGMLATPVGMGQVLNLVESEGETADLLVKELSARVQLGTQVVSDLKFSREIRDALVTRLGAKQSETKVLLQDLLGNEATRKAVGLVLTGPHTVASSVEALISQMNDERVRAFAAAFRGQNASLAKKLAHLLDPAPPKSDAPPTPRPAVRSRSGARSARKRPASTGGEPGGTPAAPTEGSEGQG